MLDQPAIHFNDFNRRHGKSNPLGEPGSEEIVCQHTSVLRIVLEFDDVEMSVIRAHQMALRASTHAFYMLDCLDRHCPSRNSALVAEFSRSA
jgi:hypothetical protein